jgi:cytochrome c peroxidase
MFRAASFRSSVVVSSAIVGFGLFAFSSNNCAENGSWSSLLSSSSSPPIDYKKVKADIVAAIEADDEKRGDGTSMAPTLVRLAWHAAGTYSIFDRTGGSNGATMRFAPESDWGANAGLKSARDFLEPIKKNYRGISYGDLWTLSGGLFLL